MDVSPILSVECNEGKHGTITRTVYPFALTPDSARKLYEQAKRFPYILGMEVPPTIEQFLDIYFYKDLNGEFKTDNLIYTISDLYKDDIIGILMLTHIYHPNDAIMHFSFFDGRIKGRMNLLRAMIKYVINEYGFYRLSTEVPCYVKSISHTSGALLYYIDRGIGLTLEGRKRKMIMYKDELFDVLLYGITKEEANHPEYI